MVLPVLVNLDGNSSLHSCDQCNQRRRRCDRKVPSCSQCQFREVDCTYNRTLKRCHVLDRMNSSVTPPSSKPARLVIIPFEKAINNTKFKSNDRNKLALYDQEQLKLTLVVERSEKLLCALSVDKIAIDWPYTVSGFIDYLKGSVHSKFPPIYIAKPCLAPCLPASSIWNNNTSQIPFNCFGLTPIKNTSLINLKSILDRALNSYLDIVNSFNPLFIKPLFNDLPRSDLIMSAIWLSGLHHIENKGPLEFQVQSILKSNLQQQAKLSLLPITFDTLQFVLVMLVGMRGFTGIDSTVRLCQSLVTRLSFVLGTHITEGRPDLLQLERRLAYNLATTTDTTRGWGLQLPYLRSIDHTFPLDSSKLLIRCFNRLVPNPNKNNGWDLGGLHYSSYLFDNIPSLFDLHLLHNKLMLGTVTLSELKSEANINLEKTQEISINYVRSFYNMQIQLELDVNVGSVTESYVNGSLMYSRVLCYAIASIIPMAESDPRLNKFTPQCNSPSLNIVLDWAFQVIAASLQFPTHIPVFEGRIFLTTTALTFIARHIHLHPNQTHARLTVRKGLSHLQSLTQHTGLAEHVKDNIDIFKKVCKDLGQESLIADI